MHNEKLFFQKVEYLVKAIKSDGLSSKLLLENLVLYLIQNTQQKQQNMDLFHSRLITCTI